MTSSLIDTFVKIITKTAATNRLFYPLKWLARHLARRPRSPHAQVKRAKIARRDVVGKSQRWLFLYGLVSVFSMYWWPTTGLVSIFLDAGTTRGLCIKAVPSLPLLVTIPNSCRGCSTMKLAAAKGRCAVYSRRARKPLQ